MMSRILSCLIAVLVMPVLTGITLAQAPVATPQPPGPSKPPPVFRSRQADQDGNPREYLYINTLGIGPFIEETNKLGKIGYRLQNVAMSSYSNTVAPGVAADRFKTLPLAAIFKLDKPNTYEYEWFEADIPGEIVTRFNLRAESGFYYSQSVSFSDTAGCADSSESGSDPLGSILAVLCGSEGGVYFVERRNGEIAKREYRVHIGRFGWGKNPTAELQAALDNTGQLGFRPISLGKMHSGLSYTFYTVVERNKGADAEPIKSQYRFLKSEFSFSKKANEIAKEGFRIRFGSQFGVREYVVREN